MDEDLKSIAKQASEKGMWIRANEIIRLQFVYFDWCNGSVDKVRFVNHTIIIEAMIHIHIFIECRFLSVNYLHLIYTERFLVYS